MLGEVEFVGGYVDCDMFYWDVLGVEDECGIVLIECVLGVCEGCCYLGLMYLCEVFCFDVLVDLECDVVFDGCVDGGDYFE